MDRSFLVTGAYRQTGKPARIRIEAGDEEQAIHRAADRGVLVESVQPLDATPSASSPAPAPATGVQYLVRGFGEHDGRPRFSTITAANETEAVAKAAADGIAVDSIEPVVILPPKRRATLTFKSPSTWWGWASIAALMVGTIGLPIYLASNGNDGGERTLAKPPRRPLLIDPKEQAPAHPVETGATTEPLSASDDGEPVVADLPTHGLGWSLHQITGKWGGVSKWRSVDPREGGDLVFHNAVSMDSDWVAYSAFGTKDDLGYFEVRVLIDSKMDSEDRMAVKFAVAASMIADVSLFEGEKIAIWIRNCIDQAGQGQRQFSIVRKGLRFEMNLEGFTGGQLIAKVSVQPDASTLGQ